MSLPSHVNPDSHRILLENPNGGPINQQLQNNFDPARSQSSSSFFDRSMLTERARLMSNSGTRSIRDNIQNVFQEIRPIVQTVKYYFLYSIKVNVKIIFLKCFLNNKFLLK